VQQQSAATERSLAESARDLSERTPAGQGRSCHLWPGPSSGWRPEERQRYSGTWPETPESRCSRPPACQKRRNLSSTEIGREEAEQIAARLAARYRPLDAARLPWLVSVYPE
jgi:hypothetical protein